MFSGLVAVGPSSRTGPPSSTTLSTSLAGSLMPWALMQHPPKRIMRVGPSTNLAMDFNRLRTVASSNRTGFVPRGTAALAQVRFYARWNSYVPYTGQPPAPVPVYGVSCWVVVVAAGPDRPLFATNKLPV